MALRAASIGLLNGGLHSHVGPRIRQLQKQLAAPLGPAASSERAAFNEAMFAPRGSLV
jgi:hypothetical protein